MKAAVLPSSARFHLATASALVVLSVALVPLTAGVDPAMAGHRGGTAQSPGVERAIRDCANRNRRAAGLELLQASRVLSKAARLQARNMALRHFFDHTDQLGRGPEERVEIFDPEHRYTFVGENIAAGYTSARTACQGWMHSPGHRENILGSDYTAIGAGFSRGGDYGRYYVQVFAREAAAPSRLPASCRCASAAGRPAAAR